MNTTTDNAQGLAFRKAIRDLVLAWECDGDPAVTRCKKAVQEVIATHPPQQERVGYPIDTCPVSAVVLVWWPLVKLDEDGELTDEVCGGEWLLSEQCEDGAFFEPDELNATGGAFDDDETYARAPTFWRPLPPDPNHVAAPAAPATPDQHVGIVVNNNQPGWNNIIETAPNVTLPIGTKVCLHSDPGCGFVVANGQGTAWRMLGDSGPEWTTDRNAALRFARREDAETFSREDEDAWLIQSITASTATPESAEPVATISRKGNAIGGLVWTDAASRADLPDGTKLYTHPTPAASDGGLREAKIDALIADMEDDELRIMYEPTFDRWLAELRAICARLTPQASTPAAVARGARRFQRSTLVCRRARED